MTISKRYVLATLLLLAGISQAASVDTSAPIGKILAADGQVEAIHPDGSVRLLSRRSDLFVGETIKVGPSGRAQLRLADDSNFALQAGTEFTINAFEFDADAATADTAVMTLSKGGFRSISGRIGEAAADTSRIETPHANISGSGLLSAVLEADQLIAGVFDGTGQVSNSAGTLLLGEGGNYDFSQATADIVPAGLQTQPEALSFFDSPQDQP